MMPLSSIPRKCTEGYRFTKSQEKLFEKNEKELKTFVQTIRNYFQDKGMECGIEKYAILIMKSRKKTKNKRNRTVNQKRISTLGENENYKYLGTLKADSIKQAETKEKSKEHLRRTRKLLETKLCSRNL